MKIWVVTLTHLDLPLLRHSIEKFKETSKLCHYNVDHEHILIDHHWPIGYWEHRHGILKLAEEFGLKVMAPYQNMGGHGGYTWAMRNLPMKDDDFFLGYDGDSNPETPGWDVAMAQVLSDKNYAAVSLSINADLNCKEWVEESVNELWVKKPASGIEMFNVTMWKNTFLKQTGGLQGSNYYGYVERKMFLAMTEMGLKHGYLRDYSENLRPFDPHPLYQEWKSLHAIFKYNDNFDRFCAERGVK